MISHLAPLLLLALLGGCRSASVPGEPGPAADPSLLVGAWIQVAWHDAHHGAVPLGQGGGGADHTFSFGADGRFVEDRPGGCCREAGTWRLSPAADALQLNYDEGTERSAVRVVQTLTADTLRLAWRGRHGMVTETYAPLAK